MPESLTYDVPLVSTRYAARFFSFLASKGITLGAIQTHNPEIKEFINNPDAYLSMNQVIPIIETSQWLLNDDKAAFEFGQELGLEEHGLFGYTLLSRQDHPQLVETVVRHMQICLPVFDMEVIRNGRDVIIRLHDTWNIGKARAFIAKIYMGSTFTVASTICRNIQFDCDFSTDISNPEWSSLTPNATWNFDAQHNQITLPQIKQANKNEKLKVVYSLAENRRRNDPKQSSNNQDGKNIAAKVKEHIMKSPKNASIERSAALLDMSSRYLRQHLAQEGTSFREISNEIRQNYADLYLRDTPMPLNDIASKLGFGDQASFTHAYKNWTGKTPGEIRKNAKAERSQKEALTPK